MTPGDIIHVRSREILDAARDEPAAVRSALFRRVLALADEHGVKPDPDYDSRPDAWFATGARQP